MRPSKIIKTTLGDLIVALTDEIMPIISDPAGAYIVVSSVLDEMLTHQHLRHNNRSRQKYPHKASRYCRARVLMQIGAV